MPIDMNLGRPARDDLTELANGRTRSRRLRTRHRRVLYERSARTHEVPGITGYRRWGRRRHCEPPPSSTWRRRSFRAWTPVTGQAGGCEKASGWFRPQARLDPGVQPGQGCEYIGPWQCANDIAVQRDGLPASTTIARGAQEGRGEMFLLVSRACHAESGKQRRSPRARRHHDTHNHLHARQKATH